MSDTSSTTNLEEDLNNLRSYLIIAASVIGGVTIFSLCLIIILFFWVYYLSKKIKKLNPLASFKILRPKLNRKSTPRNQNQQQQRYNYDNPGFNRNYDNNPLAISQPNNNTMFDNGNFSYENNVGRRHSESYRNPANRLNRDSKFY